jgi:hypothetical protein
LISAVAPVTVHPAAVKVVADAAKMLAAAATVCRWCHCASLLMPSVEEVVARRKQLVDGKIPS